MIAFTILGLLVFWCACFAEGYAIGRALDPQAKADPLWCGWIVVEVRP